MASLVAVRSFEDAPLPGAMVVDASFLFEALIDSTPRHREARAFAERLRDEETTLVYSPPLVFLEAPQFWKRLSRAPDGTNLSDRERIARADAFQEWSSELSTFLDRFNRLEVALDESLLNMGVRHAGTYNLSSHDAVIVGITSVTGYSDVVTLDGRFRRIGHITVWCCPD